MVAWRGSHISLSSSRQPQNVRVEQPLWPNQATTCHQCKLRYRKELRRISSAYLCCYDVHHLKLVLPTQRSSSHLTLTRICKRR